MVQNALSPLTGGEFLVYGITALGTDFASGSVVDYRAEGRSKHLLHIVTSGARAYELGERHFTVRAGSVLLIPDGTHYATTALTEGGSCKGIGICFLLKDENGAAVRLPQGIYTEEGESAGSLLPIFEEMARCYSRTPVRTMRMQSLLMRLLDHLSGGVGESPRGEGIGPALSMLSLRYRENLPVEEYAAACHMSVSWFRKRFSAATGMSPVEYRNELRFDEAKRLAQMGLGTQEIAERVGFGDAGYLLKLYKRRRGVSLRRDAGIGAV